MTWFSPGDVADRTGLSLDTLRYYEREGLIGPVRRDSGGRRLYSGGDLAWLGVVTCLRRSGMGIADLRRFVGVVRGGAPASTEPVEMLRLHRSRLVEDIEHIRVALSVIDGKIAHYERAGARSA
ncbi:MerR family transcriptional regulator [Actinoallomurus vinaceus]|uniref:MerR family transcriptional regulator n=1 Tax=Actinoallomurus vinaceus TaxID=1080074 RepID=A0ABP8U322_9ACTN